MNEYFEITSINNKSSEVGFDTSEYGEVFCRVDLTGVEVSDILEVQSSFGLCPYDFQEYQLRVHKRENVNLDTVR